MQRNKEDVVTIPTQPTGEKFYFSRRTVASITFAICNTYGNIGIILFRDTPEYACKVRRSSWFCLLMRSP